MRLSTWTYTVVTSLSLARAQCAGPAITITSATDALSISTCETYHGDIVIGPSAVGEIALNGIRTITGNLSASQVPKLTSLRAANLAEIGGTFDLYSLDILSELNFPILTNVLSIKWTTLPALQTFTNSVGISRVNTISISNTQLTKLSGFNLATAESIDINSNAHLETVSMSSLVNVTRSLLIEANAPNVNLLFDSIRYAGNLTFRNISGLSLPALTEVKGSLTCYSCAIATFRANNIATTGGSITFVSNDLQSLAFPQLVHIGGNLQLSNNSYLTQIDGFHKLESIDGSLQLNGNFKGLNFNGLTNVKGDVSVETSSTNSSICDGFNAALRSQVIKGSLECETGVSLTDASDNTSNIHNSTGTASNDDKDMFEESRPQLSPGAIAGIVVGLVLVILIAAGVIFIFLSLARPEKGTRTKDVELELDSDCSGRHELSLEPQHQRAELHVDPNPVAELNGVNGNNSRSVTGLYEMGDTSLKSRHGTAVTSSAVSLERVDEDHFDLSRVVSEKQFG